ncbi:MAG: type I-E CRISPR-associated protein Cas7/Cse4/CasC [Christensenellales bacterium]
MTSRMFLDIHALQSVPPANINRDDTGSPKTAQYGGVRRARVSSQACKRSIREYFKEFGDEAQVGVRTLDIVSYLAGKITALDSSISEKEVLELANKTLNNAGISTKDFKARALLFVGEKQVERLAQAVIDGETNKRILQGILKDSPAIDIALFGRMLADDPSLNEDASSQVAHAISTHAIENEYDFFTALDDLSPENNAGAGMLGTIEFNSSTLYRYANVAVHEFIKQIGDKDAAVKALNLFIEAFIKSMPTGKSNTFANLTLPGVVIVSLRRDRPVNLVTAFEEPVKSSSGYMDKSAERLYQEFDCVQGFASEAEFTLALSLKEKNAYKGTYKVENVKSIEQLLNAFAENMAIVLS